MKNKYTWLILGIVIGIVVSVAACWIWCCSCKSSCERTCVHMVISDSVKEISADSARLLLHSDVVPTDTAPATTRTMSLATTTTTTPCPALKAFMVNRQVLSAMNSLATNPLATSFRVYVAYSGTTVTSTVVIGVNSSGRDIPSPTYTVSSTGVGPCPDVCDTGSPLY